MRALEIAKNPYISLVINFLYAAGNCTIGFVTHSWWFVTVGAYYTVLAATRFSVLSIKRKANVDFDIDFFAKRITGILLILLSFCLIGVNILAVINERGTKFHEIIMISIATYTFTKVTVAIIGLVKSKRQKTPITTTLRKWCSRISIITDILNSALYFCCIVPFLDIKTCTSKSV